MADNVTLNSGTGGAVCSTDDCGAAGHTQVVKLAIATDGSATRIPADAKGLYVQQPTAADLNCTIAAVPAGSNLIGDVALQSRAAGGATCYSLISAANANLTSITDGATNLLGMYLSNTNAAVRYVKLFNKATAPDPSEAAGADIPVLRFAVPGATTGGLGVLTLTVGAAFSTGLGMCIVTGVADNDETGVAANEIIVNLWYKH